MRIYNPLRSSIYRAFGNRYSSVILSGGFPYTFPFELG